MEGLFAQSQSARAQKRPDRGFSLFVCFCLIATGLDGQELSQRRVDVTGVAHEAGRSSTTKAISQAGDDVQSACYPPSYRAQ
jgi:hypothetical protein